MYLMNLFEYMFQNHFGVRFIWTAGFMSWILGCCFWVSQVELVSLILTITSIVLCLLAIFATSDMDLNEFSNWKKTRLELSVYVSIISASVVTMIASKSLAVGFTMNILLFLLLYNWKEFKETKKQRLYDSLIKP